MKRKFSIDRDAIYEASEAASACGTPTSTVKAAIQNGELLGAKRGRLTFVEGESLWRWLTGRPQLEEVTNG